MPSQLVRPAELRAVDRFFESLNSSKDFVNFVQSPDYLDKLRIAVSHLVSNWPTMEEIVALRSAAKETLRYTQADKMVLDGLEGARAFDYMSGFNADTSSNAEAAELFAALYRERPQGRSFYDRFQGLDGLDSVLSKIFNIAKLD